MNFTFPPYLKKTAEIKKRKDNDKKKKKNVSVNKPSIQNWPFVIVQSDLIQN